MSSTITSSVTTNVTFGRGTYTSPLTITSFGTVAPASGIAIYAGPSYANPTLSNQGGLVDGGVGAVGRSGGGAGGSGAAAISLSDGGTIDNTGSIVGGAGGQGGGDSSSNYGGNGGAGGTAILLSAGGTIVNSGAIAGGQGGGGGVGSFGLQGPSGAAGAGVVASGGGYVDNSGYITGGSSGVLIEGAAGTVTNDGSISATGIAGLGVELAAGGTLVNGNISFTTARIAGGTGAAGAGGYTGGAGGAGGAGVSLSGAGSIGNAGTIAGGGGGQGGFGYFNGAVGGSGGAAVRLASGTIDNTGSIVGGYGGQGGGADAGTGDGGNGGAGGTAIVLSGGGTVVNSGAIEGGQGGAGGLGISSYGQSGAAGAGIVLSDGGYVDNSGYITGGTGLLIEGAAGTVTNDGSISATGASGIGVDLAAGGTLVNGNISFTTARIAGGTGGAGAASSGFSNGGAGGAGGAGVSLSGAGSIGNAGTIAGGGGGAGGNSQYNGGPGGSGAAGISLSSGTIDNAGSIAGGAGANGGNSTVHYYHGGNGGAGGAGIVLSGGGTIDNTGSVAGGAGGQGGNAAGNFSYGGNGGAGGGGIVLSGGGTVVNSGTIAGAQGGARGTGSYRNGQSGAAGAGIALSAGGTVIDSGTISGTPAITFGGAGSNLLVLEKGYLLTGAVAGSSTAGAVNTLELLGTAGALTLNFNGLTLSNFGTVAFGAPSGNSDTLKITNTAALPGTISSFNQYGDVIDLTQISPAGVQTPTLENGHQLVVTNGSQTVTLNLDSENYSDVAWMATPDGTGGADVGVACYCRGTLIRTPAGEVPVEMLAIGDLVVTVSGAAKPVRWIGRRAYDGRFVADNRAVLPVRIEAGAVAEAIPLRDLWVSPEHALYIDGALAPARLLANGMTIVQADAVGSLEYFHIELDTHDVIFADGMPAETYVDCDNRLMFQNASAFADLYPLDERPTWAFCAPRLEAGSAELSVIREALFERAAVLGHRLDFDPDLHLVVDGVIIRSDAMGARLYRFAIPAGSNVVSLASRSAVPAEVGYESQDGRRLGVPVERIAISDSGLAIEAWHSHAALCNGFHDDEGTHRWTDGLAHLPSNWLASFPNGATLDVHLISTAHCYRLAPSPAAPQGSKRPQDRREGDAISTGEPCTAAIGIMVEPEVAFCSAA